MKVETPYFWFRLFKTPGIGPKSLALIAEELEKHQLQPKNLPLNSSTLSSQYPELAHIINGKIRAEDSERIYAEWCHQTCKIIPSSTKFGRTIRKRSGFNCPITILHPSPT